MKNYDNWKTTKEVEKYYCDECGENLLGTAFYREDKDKLYCKCCFDSYLDQIYEESTIDLI